MEESPRGEDEAPVARSGGSEASGCRDWARAGREASRTRCCRFAIDRTHQRNRFAQFRGLPWKRHQGRFQLHRYPGTSI